MLMDVVRYACGQINKSESVKAQEAAKKAKDGERIPPSPKIKAARELFSARCFKGGNQGGHAGDPIGQLWLLAHKTAKYERASRTSNASADPTKTERSYYRYSSFLLDAADYDVDCLESLMEETLDGDIVSWVSRIIQTELLRFVRLPLAELACDDDYARLDAARRALRALAGAGALRRDAA
jgi:hypothetical protein